MFSVINSKKLHVSTMLMGMALMSYLVLFLAGSMLHNDPFCFSFLNDIEELHTRRHKDPCCPKHEKHDHHNEENHHDCLVCHFNAVAAGAVLAEAVAVPSALLFLCEVLWNHNPLHLSQFFSRFYPRDPPSFSS